MTTREQEHYAKKRCEEADMEESQGIMGVTNYDGIEILKDVEPKESTLTSYEEKCAELEERISIIVRNYQAARGDTMAQEIFVRKYDK